MSGRSSLPDPSRQHEIGLDLLRALAILLVMFSHYANNFSYWLGWHPPHDVFFTGDLGVDLFFALSGFLIGRILIDIADAAPSWANLRIFLLRRWMRTLPAYWVWLAVLAAAFPPAGGIRTVLPFVAMSQNLVGPMPRDYWFAVSWSLPIEEWFYLLFGAGVVVAARLLRHRNAIWLPLLLLLGLPLLLRFSTPGYLDWARGLTQMVPFRLDEIGYGVVFAWLYARRRGTFLFRWPLLSLPVGAGLIAAAWWNALSLRFDLFVILQHNLSVLGCALCLPAALRLRALPAPLDWLARQLSRHAYTLYLVHLTILVDVVQATWFVHGLSTPAAIVLALLLPPLVAALLSLLVERPIMRLRPRQRLPHAAASAVARTATAGPPRTASAARAAVTHIAPAAKNAGR